MLFVFVVVLIACLSLDKVSSDLYEINLVLWFVQLILTSSDSGELLA